MDGPLVLFRRGIIIVSPLLCVLVRFELIFSLSPLLILRVVHVLFAEGSSASIDSFESLQKDLESTQVTHDDGTLRDSTAFSLEELNAEAEDAAALSQRSIVRCWYPVMSPGSEFTGSTTRTEAWQIPFHTI